jgi:hypothetical protein
LAIEGAAEEIAIVSGGFFRIDLHEKGSQDLVDVVGVLIV